MRLPSIARLSNFWRMCARYDDHIERAYLADCSHSKIRAAQMSIKDWPLSERPREKLLARGAHCLSDAELLAVLLGSSGRRGTDAVARARDLLSQHQSLRKLLCA